MRVLVIVPAYNEEGNLPVALRDLADSGVEADVLVVNDGSLDSTSSVARGFGHGVMVAELPLNLGIGGAVQTGLIYALEHGYDVAVQFDGDAQHRADQIALLLAPLREGADLVIGSRFLGAEGGYRVGFMRRLAIRLLSAGLSALCGMRVTDGTSGFRAMSRRAISVFAGDYPEDYPEVEAVIMARRQGLSVREVPVLMRARQWGKSSITPLYSIYYIVKVSLAVGVRMGRKSQK